jgi:exopolyphosphatase/guanosine-5'-triphosphate,3'-diphosphate pyrophosphatase
MITHKKGLKAMVTKNLFGVIYMSTAKLELLIANLKSHEIIERASSASFVQVADKSKIYQTEMDKIVFSLNGFLQILHDYGVKSYRFWASQQLIDDVTARYLNEQLYLRTGLHVHWLNTSQLNYFRATSLIGHTKELTGLSEKTTYLLYIGSAAATLSKFKDQEFIQAWNISLGYLEIDKLMHALRNTANDPNEIIDDYIGSKLDYLRIELADCRPGSNLVLQDFSGLNNLYLSADSRTGEIPVKDFLCLIKNTLDASTQSIMKKFNINESVSAHTVPGFMITRRIMKYVKAKRLWLTRMNLWDGLAFQTAFDKGLMKRDFTTMTLTSSENLARRYLSDDAHRRMNMKLALHLFDQLKKLHRLGSRERLLLAVAVNIADIGNFIGQHGHYRHSAYIMEATPIIGLSDKENRIIAEVARYHSAETPDVDQHHYSHLDAEIQMPVAKLVAILRLADSLDDSRQQKISRISVSLRENAVVLTAFSAQNLALEKWAFDQKAQLFHEVYGIKVILKQRRTVA